MTRVPKPPVVEKVRKPLQRTGRIARTSRLTPKARKPSETLRIYGPLSRQEWVREQDCAVYQLWRLYASHECAGPIHLHHTATGGKGRKAGAETIVGLCARHHAELHQRGRDAFEATYQLSLTSLAAETQKKWLDHSAPSPGVDLLEN